MKSELFLRTTELKTRGMLFIGGLDWIGLDFVNFMISRVGVELNLLPVLALDISISKTFESS